MRICWTNAFHLFYMLKMNYGGGLKLSLRDWVAPFFSNSVSSNPAVRERERFLFSGPRGASPNEMSYPVGTHHSLMLT